MIEVAFDDLNHLPLIIKQHAANRALALDILDALHDTHSYHKTAYRELPFDKPSTLGYLIEDYFAHMEYHLHQIQDIESANLDQPYHFP